MADAHSRPPLLRARPPFRGSHGGCVAPGGSPLRRMLLLANVLVAGMLGAACAPKSPPRHAMSAPAESRKARHQREAAERELQLRAFDHAWQRIADTYPHADFRGLDWNAVRDELRPRAARCRSAAALRPVLQEMLARLGESHFQILPGDGLDAAAAPSPAPVASASQAQALGDADGGPGDVGMEVRRVGDEFLVSRLDPEGPAARAGLRMGWRIVSVGDLHVGDLLRRATDPRAEGMAQYVAWAALTGSMRGEPGTSVIVSAAPPGEAGRPFELERRPMKGQSSSLGNLPDLVAEFESRMLPGDVGYIRFSMFLVPIAAPFSEAMRDFVARDAKGVIIDLRGNPGGIGGLVMGLGGHFFDEQGLSLGSMKTRQADLQFVANPRGPGAVFEGPVAILVDAFSLSTSELFAAGLQQLGRARVFGERTGGMALPSIVEGLPNGDRMQFAVADLLGPGGRRIEGVGVLPDEEVPLRADDLVAGRDAALEAALRWVNAGGSAPPGS